jgi:hypothetical protein
MVIGNLDIESMAAFPAKADSVLIVDSNTVLPRSISPQRLQAVCRWRGKIADFFRAVDLDEPAERYRRDLLESSDPPTLEDRFGVPAAK